MRFKDDFERELYYIAQIDCAYWLVSELQKEMDKPRSPIARMIDVATGYDIAMQKEQANQFKSLLKLIIRCKEKIGKDTTGDKEALSRVNDLRKRLSTPHNPAKRHTQGS